MLHDGHELDNIVAKFLDSGKDVFGEFWICPYSVFGSRDAH